MKKVGMIFLLSLLFSPFAKGMTLNEAKQQGLVGETFSGYLAPVKNGQEAQSVVKKINNERQKKYAEIAAQNNMTTEQVARMAGEKLVNRAASGEYVLGINGNWVQK
ncbi:YdbL family protein [Xenorhabdus griffiniae]|uniref:YdbL family protein n=1 Tax=Xenorhabdus griffiniae TaxID=351672 RepID=A0ABY9XCT8_9GAMM|nr:YdbL family protein [Xenorhabdus griffiniae]MBD1226471.1 YdbL family protein [Xenorhabdus griffiniae]MBE8587136.1 YdbL family protein [Xenorhabdus griffiniae]WMV70697.1 YdbL family protein [Xenorhabdus griffiniae]WNH00374.1 YdbL family protein [Xenorhabdus griffiniae]